MSLVLDELLTAQVVDVRDVAMVTGVSTRTVSQWRAATVLPRAATADRIGELKVVVDELRRVLRDEPARLWLRSPNTALDWRNPLELIAEGEHRRVVATVLATAEGVTA
jgi:transcriptional regulator with XRE-family HTH domain